MNSPTPSHQDPFARKGLLLPYVWLAALGLAALCVAGFVAVKAIANGGLLPAPSVLQRYTCPGAGAPFSFYFLHGQARVRIQTDAGQRTGTLRNGQIDWFPPAAGEAALGLTAPTEIIYDDAQSLRLSGAGFAPVRCTRAPGAAAPQ